jgi:hypothetical protein
MLVPFIAVAFITAEALDLAPHGPWDQFNFAPENRISHPTKVRSIHGNVKNANALVASGIAEFEENGSFVTLDFGQEVSVDHMKPFQYMGDTDLSGWWPRFL